MTRSIGLPALRERDHLVEDAPVGVAEEVTGIDDLRRQVERVVVEQDRPEHGSLRFEIVRQRAIGDGGIRHRQNPESSEFGL